MSRWRLLRMMMWGGVLVMTALWLLLGILPRMGALRHLNARTRAVGSELNALAVQGADVAPLDEVELGMKADLDQDWEQAFPSLPPPAGALWEGLAQKWGDLGRRAGLDHLALSLRTGREALSASPIWVGQEEGLRALLELMARQTGSVFPDTPGHTGMEGRQAPDEAGLQEVILGGTGSLAAWSSFLRQMAEQQAPYLCIRSIHLMEGGTPVGMLRLSVFTGRKREAADG